MEISPEELINGLLEENKRLTLENIVLKMTLQKIQSNAGKSSESQ